MKNKKQKSNLADLKKQAEALLVKKKYQIDKLSADKIQKIFHDLQTYQIELEIQNEELRRTQEELLVSTENYISLYNSAPIGYLTINKKGLILEANLTLSDMLTIERKDLIKKQLTRFIHKNDQDVFYKHSQDVFTGKCRQSCELRMKNKGDRWFWANLVSVPLEDMSGGELQIRIAIVDITTQKKSETDLRNSEEKYRLLFENMSDGLTVLDATGAITFANRKFYELIGYNKKEVIGRQVADFLSPENKKIFQKKALACKKGTTEPYEIQWTRKDGEAIQTSMNPSNNYDSKGNHVGCFHIVRDLTKIKHLENSLEKSESIILERTYQIEKKNIALSEIIRQIDAEKEQFEMRVTSNVEKLLLPILTRLRSRGTLIEKEYIDLLERNVKELTSPFGYHVSDANLKLSQREIEICNLIKNGLRNKEISKLLHLSIGTVEVHRTNIRKSLVSRNKK